MDRKRENQADQAAAGRHIYNQLQERAAVTARLVEQVTRALTLIEPITA